MTSEAVVTRRPAWLWVGLISALLLLPVAHLGAVDLESTDPAAFLARAADRHTSITAAASIGIAVACGVLVAFLGLRRIAPPHRRFVADALTAIGCLGVVGLVLSSLGSMLAAYAAHEGYPYEVVRTFGVLADGAAAVLGLAFAGPAALVAILGSVDRVVPRALGWVSALFAALIACVGLIVPGAALLPAIGWYVTCMVFLAIAGSTPDGAVVASPR
jgi:hypothetical protein